MRFPLISDTLGRLGVIDEPADRIRADAVIQAGDFGFFDDVSFKRFSDREPRLHAAHSDLPRTERARILALSRNDLMRTVGEHRLLGAFRSFLEGVESFHVPVSPGRRASKRRTGKDVKGGVSEREHGRSTRPRGDHPTGSCVK